MTETFPTVPFHAVRLREVIPGTEELDRSCSGVVAMKGNLVDANISQKGKSYSMNVTRVVVSMSSKSGRGSLNMENCQRKERLI